MDVTCSSCNGCTPLCVRCRTQSFDALRSTAWARGRRWGAELRQRWPRRRWPAETSARMRAAAIERISDLGRDVGLRELLLDEVLIGAREAYELQAEPQPGSVAFRVGWQAERSP